MGKVWAGIVTDLLQLQHQVQELSLWALPALWGSPGEGREGLAQHWDHPKLPLGSAVLPLGHSHGMGWAGRDLRVKCDFSSQFLMLMPPLWNNRSQNALSEPCPSSIPAGILWVRSGENFQGSWDVPLTAISTAPVQNHPKAAQSLLSVIAVPLFPRKPSPASFLFKDYKRVHLFHIAGKLVWSSNNRKNRQQLWKTFYFSFWIAKVSHLPSRHSGNTLLWN